MIIDCILLPPLRKALSILLAFAILAQGMINLGLCAYYQMNKKMIADKLCINKDKPELHCNGQCFLSKQLKKAEENEKRQSKSMTEKDEVVTHYDHTELAAYIPSFVTVGMLMIYQPHAYSSVLLSIDRPPRA